MPRKKVGSKISAGIVASTQTEEEELQEIARSSCSNDSLGLRTYLKRVMKHKYDENTDKLVQEALSKYRKGRKGRNEKEQPAKHSESAPLPKAHVVDGDKKEQIKEPMDGCGSMKRKKRNTAIPPDSVGLKNYFTMFKCRHPQMEECAAYKKASRIYNNLTPRTKLKYRSMGCAMDSSCPTKNLKIKQSAAVRSAKPKRKRALAEPACSPKPKRRTSKKCRT